MSYDLMMRRKGAGKDSLRKGDFAAAETDFLAALAEARKFHQPNAYTVLMLRTVGVYYFALTRFAEARDYFLESLTIERQIFGAESLEAASGLNLMGLLYQFVEDYDRAEEAYTEALAIQKNAAFAKIPSTSTKTHYMSLHHLSIIKCIQGKSGEALRLCQQASEEVGRILGPGGRDLTSEFQSLSVECCHGGRHHDGLATCRWMLNLCAQELQREFLGAVICAGSGIRNRPAHLSPESDILAYLYEEAWRPAVIGRLASGLIRNDPHTRLKEESEGGPCEDGPDLWRPRKASR